MRMLPKKALMPTLSYLCLADAVIRLLWHPNDVQT